MGTLVMGFFHYFSVSIFTLFSPERGSFNTIKLFATESYNTVQLSHPQFLISVTL